MNQTDICNLALTTLGADRITNINDESENARKCTALWEMIRMELLRVHPWAFARKRVKIPATASTNAYGYQYQFQIPSDCMRVVDVLDGLDESAEIEDWKKEGGLILSDSQTLYLGYVADVKDANAFTKDFATAFAARLASMLCWSITNSASLTKTLMDYATEQLRMAKATDSQESGLPDVQGGDTFVKSRF